MPSWAESREYLAWLAARGGPDPSEYGMLKKLFDAVHAKEFRVVDGASVALSEASSLDPALDEARQVFRSTASMQGFSYVKPHGYAGDFEIIERICTSVVSSISHITRWDRFFHEGDAPRAVRNRSSLLGGLIREARPVVSSISTSAPRNRTSPFATGNCAGRFEMKRCTIGSTARPMIEFTGPHIPASQRNAVPPGKICSSAVCT